MAIESIIGADPNEVVIHRLRRHPIGAVLIWASTLSVFVLLFALLFIVVRSASNDLGVSDTMLGTVAIALGLLVLLFGYIAASIYRANELIVTNENLIQILQQSLFDRKVSQLNLSKIQDVTVDQEGFIATQFNYGTLTIETAGEASNYVFKYAPNPTIQAKHIIEAHEQYLRTNTNNPDRPVPPMDV